VLGLVYKKNGQSSDADSTRRRRQTGERGGSLNLTDFVENDEEDLYEKLMDMLLFIINQQSES
jgi:hypothetical protein